LEPARQPAGYHQLSRTPTLLSCRATRATGPALTRPTAGTPGGIRTTATVTLEKQNTGFTITAVHLEVAARIPGANQQAFQTAANEAKTGCPISKVLNAPITMEAALES
jgi:organic hydroperoxide reductase OsmC/OhrA